MALYIGRSGPCVWTLVHGPLDEAVVAEFTAHLRHLGETLQPGEVVLDLLYDMPMPTPVQRRAIVDALQSTGKMDDAGAHALASNSTIGRGLLTAINWVVRPAFPESVFSEPLAAIEWLATHSDGVDRRDVVSSIEAAYPGFRKLRW